MSMNINYQNVNINCNVDCIPSIIGSRGRGLSVNLVQRTISNTMAFNNTISLPQLMDGPDGNQYPPVEMGDE